jgi:hypothetical protein
MKLYYVELCDISSTHMFYLALCGLYYTIVYHIVFEYNTILYYILLWHMHLYCSISYVSLLFKIYNSVVSHSTS